MGSGGILAGCSLDCDTFLHIRCHKLAGMQALVLVSLFRTFLRLHATYHWAYQVLQVVQLQAQRRCELLPTGFPLLPDALIRGRRLCSVRLGCAEQKAAQCLAAEGVAPTEAVDAPAGDVGVQGARQQCGRLLQEREHRSVCLDVRGAPPL
jgi:hypothetical protein